MAAAQSADSKSRKTSKATAETGIGKELDKARDKAELSAFSAASRKATIGSLNLIALQVANGQLDPLLPANQITNINTFRASWNLDGAKLFEKCREMASYSGNDFIGQHYRLKESYFAQGFRVLGKQDYFSSGDGLELMGILKQLNQDVWSEFLPMRAAVAFWKRPVAGAGFPKVTILDCEDVEYTNVMSEEIVKIKPKQCKLDESLRAKIGDRWFTAITKGEMITLDRQNGECCKVLRLGKLGSSGLGVPPMKEILDLLSMRQLLKLGDWAGAWLGKDVIRQIRKGHEIKSGPLAGQPTHFIKSGDVKRMTDQTKSKGGAYSVISNWDVLYSYIFLDPKFFDARKYEGVMEMLRAWGGPLEEMRQQGMVSPALFKMFEQEGLRDRERVADLIESIVNDPDFVGDSKKKLPKEVVKVGWNPHAFKSFKDLMEWVRTASNGQASPQTQRDALGLDDQVESERMRVAYEHLEDYTPPFEPRQGMGGGVKKNGRPTGETPGKGVAGGAGAVAAGGET